ncbi:MAG TPA: ComF family protein [Tissierellia bacterium]|nr:ComF family protein [Tissierellia bacterium]
MGLLKSLSQFLFPEENTCLFCMSHMEGEEGHICNSCSTLIEFAHREIDFHGPYLRKAYYSVIYNRFIKENIHLFKYEGKSYLYKAFGELLLESINIKGLSDKIDMVAFVPMHRRKLAQRGYNQSQLLAQYVSRKLNKPLLKNNIVKVKMTREQSRLGMLERRKNLKGSFKAVGFQDFKDKEILLIDDIITTGATMEEISKVLMEGGAKGVYGLAITSSMKI